MEKQLKCRVVYRTQTLFEFDRKYRFEMNALLLLGSTDWCNFADHSRYGASIGSARYALLRYRGDDVSHSCAPRDALRVNLVLHPLAPIER